MANGPSHLFHWSILNSELLFVFFHIFAASDARCFENGVSGPKAGSGNGPGIYV